MKNIIITTALLFFIFSCAKEDRLDNFFIEFVTIIEKEPKFVSLLKDDGTLLKTKHSPSLSKLHIDDRIIIHYTPVEDNFIRINSFQNIFVDYIKEEGYPEEISTHPIQIVSVWLGGSYLNMAFKTEFHSQQHKAALYKDTNALHTTYYFSYSREEDPPGAPTLTYLSFNLKNVEDEELTLFINTYDGERKFVLTTK